jgi:phage-related protein
MTSPLASDLKEVLFVTRSVREDLRNDFPQEVFQVVHQRLFLLQNGIRLPENQNRSLDRNGEGIQELRIPFKGAAFRVYHASMFREVIYVLDAQNKKSSTGSNIPKADIDRLLTRLKDVAAHYRDHGAELVRRFDERLLRRRVLAERDPTWDRTSPPPLPTATRRF